MLDNLALQGFKNLIVLNGHGGNSAVLNAAATKVANARRVRVLVVNWWTLADDITKAVFKQNGGHAGNNETAYVQAIVPQHVHPERYRPEMAEPNAPAGAYYTVPVASTILLYEKGRGLSHLRRGPGGQGVLPQGQRPRGRARSGNRREVGRSRDGQRAVRRGAAGRRADP